MTIKNRYQGGIDFYGETFLVALEGDVERKSNAANQAVLPESDPVDGFFRLGTGQARAFYTGPYKTLSYNVIRLKLVVN